MTAAELLALAQKEALQTTVTPSEFLLAVRTKPSYDFHQAHWFKAMQALELLKHPPPPPPPPKPPPTDSLFSGKGVFTTSNAGTASGLQSAWVAIQKDPEGDGSPTFNNNPGRLCFWQARPTQAVADEANRKDVPYIGQAEAQPELEACLGLRLTVPKAIIGNPTAWTQAGFDEAARQGWDLVLEWYWNAMPWQTQPDAHGYPLFRNVCFGTYDASGEHPGTGRRVSVAEYRAVWHGPFSCWPAETMTDADRIAYNA
ncbi:MAG TPA: hypothetical protein VL371_15830 [Gemmataceae bacterium]|nr:hypothetical protein [Gemmataceae bacterium]